jgi:chain length determinant protein EpsF
VTVITAVALSMSMQKTYKATTMLLLHYSSADPVTGVPAPAQMINNLIATQADIVGSTKVAAAVIDKLGLANTPMPPKPDGTPLTLEERKNALVGWLMENIDVKTGRESSVLKLTFKANEPKLAALVANTYASQYQQASSRFKADPARNARAYFDNQVKGARERLEEAQNRLSTFQKQNGIVNADSRLDVENARLHELSNQLVAVQAQLTDARSRGAQARGNASGSPDINANPLIQNLNNELAKARTNLSYIAERFKEGHPRYQEQKAEVDKLTQELNRQIRANASSIDNNAAILRQREAELQAAFQAQKTKMLDINRLRDQLAVYVRDIENAQRAYDSVAQRYSQISIEGQSNQSDVSVLSPAEVPLEPSSPKLALNLVASVFMGLLLGAGLALVAELLDRRVRSVTDIGELVDAPMLGILQHPRRSRFGLIAMARRALPHKPALNA